MQQELGRYLQGPLVLGMSQYLHMYLGSFSQCQRDASTANKSCVASWELALMLDVVKVFVPLYSDGRLAAVRIISRGATKPECHEEERASCRRSPSHGRHSSTCNKSWPQGKLASRRVWAPTGAVCLSQGRFAVQIKPATPRAGGALLTVFTSGSW